MTATDPRALARALNALYESYSLPELDNLVYDALSAADSESEEAFVAVLLNVRIFLSAEIRDWARLRVAAFNDPQLIIMALLELAHVSDEADTVHVWWDVLEAAKQVMSAMRDKWISRICAQIPREIWPQLLGRILEAEADHRLAILFNMAIDCPVLISRDAMLIAGDLGSAKGAEFLGIMAAQLPQETLAAALAFVRECGYLPKRHEAELRLAMSAPPVDRWSIATAAIQAALSEDFYESERFLEAGAELLRDSPGDIKLEALLRIVQSCRRGSRADFSGSHSELRPIDTSRHRWNKPDQPVCG